MKLTLPYNFDLRDYQEDLFNARFIEKKKRLVCVWHRRAGKSKCAINILVSAAVERPGIYYHMFPELTQARKVIWNGIDSEGFRYINHIPRALVKRINNQEMLVELWNGSIIQLASADRYNAVMGSNPLGIVFDEFSLCNPLSWHYLRPILAENGGWALFIYTPRGHNHGFDLYDNNKHSDDWFVQSLNCNITKRIDGSRVVTEEIIAEERKSGMPEELIQQEFYCSFESSLVGAYYSKELEKAKEEKRIGKFPINPRLPLISFWDIGVHDPTAIWIMQPDGNKCYMVGYYENNNEGVEHYIDYLHKFSMKCGAKFIKHFAPHDVKAREWTTNRSRFETARSLGINFIIVKNIAFQDGIQAARTMFPVTYFDENNCSIGIRFLHEYRRKYSEERKIFDDKEDHNYAAHCAASFRYYAVAWQDSMQYKHTYQQQQIKDWDPLSSY